MLFPLLRAHFLPYLYLTNSKNFLPKLIAHFYPRVYELISYLSIFPLNLRILKQGLFYLFILLSSMFSLPNTVPAWAMNLLNGWVNKWKISVRLIPSPACQLSSGHIDFSYQNWVQCFFFFFLDESFFLYLFYLFLAALGLRFCARAFSSCGKRGPLFIAVRRPLTITASPAAEHRLQTRRLSSCGSRAQPLRGMRDPPKPGLEPVSPALAGRLSTTAPPGKPWVQCF